MTERIKQFFSNRFNVALAVALLVLLLGGVFVAVKILSNRTQAPLQEVDLPFDPQGPYGLLVPRRDGNAILLNIKRVSNYDAISYELAYQSTNDAGQSVDRGVTGNIDTKNKQSEYNQEVLFGTCSRGNTMDPLHCVFDKNVENGTLTLKIQKGNILYRMVTTWHLQKPDVALGVITSGDSHFNYKTDASREVLAQVGFTLVNDLSGAPRLPDGKQILGKVYAFNVPPTREFPKGTVRVELAQNPPEGAKIARYVDAQNSWETLDTKIQGAVLTANAGGAGIFTVLVNDAK